MRVFLVPSHGPALDCHTVPAARPLFMNARGMNTARRHRKSGVSLRAFVLEAILLCSFLLDILREKLGGRDPLAMHLHVQGDLQQGRHPPDCRSCSSRPPHTPRTKCIGLTHPSLLRPDSSQTPRPAWWWRRGHRHFSQSLYVQVERELSGTGTTTHNQAKEEHVKCRRAGAGAVLKPDTWFSHVLTGLKGLLPSRSQLFLLLKNKVPENFFTL